MTPRDLDARLAVVLFGRTIVANEDCEGHGGDEKDEFFHYRPSLVNQPMEVCAAGVPKFSGSWEGMSLVVEAMHERAFVWILTRGPGAAIASFHSFPMMTKVPAGNAEHESSAPMAVALAALRALGEKVE